jgi:hypothetical protein
MDILEEDFNIKGMYEYQINELDKNSYQKYLKYLTLFYSKDHKKDKYEKMIMNGKFLLVDKVNPNKKIEITPSKFINIKLLYIELKEYSDKILFKINNLIEQKSNITEDNRKDFDNLKKQYIICKEKISEIDDINKEYYKDLETMLNDKIEKTILLAKYYQKRNEEYNKINIQIKEELKNKLIKYFKENKKKIPSLSIINKIAKDNNIPSDEIEKWFDWIESVYKYMAVQIELNNIEKKLKEYEEEYDINTKYMIIKKPDIKE